MDANDDDDVSRPTQPEGGAIPAQGRLVALDVGDRRVGVAVSDPLRITARGVLTLRRTTVRADIEAIRQFVQQQAAVAVVVGYPRLPSGDRGEQAIHVERFLDALRPALQVPVALWDESYTTLTAQSRMGLRGKRASEAGLDAEAAAVILEEWMRSQAPATASSDIAED